MTELLLCYPRSWLAPVHPLATLIERDTLQWLQERGVVTDAAGRDTFFKLDVGRYGGCPFPYAATEPAHIITRYLSLWIYYDDLLEEQADGLEETLHSALSGTLAVPAEASPILRCWAELGRKTAALMSRDWSSRHARHFAEWARSVREESVAVSEYRSTGRLPKTTDHLARRTLNIGVYPTLDFIELQHGRELPATVRAHPAFARLRLVSAELIAIVNDLFGYTKDAAGRWCNIVSCLAAEYDEPLSQAFTRAVRMHDDRVTAIVQLESLLLEAHPQARLWCDGLHAMCSGFTQWHATARRYRATHSAGGETVRLRLAAAPASMAA